MSRIAAPVQTTGSTAGLRASLRDMIGALSLALDAVDDNSISQHRMVAYVSVRIALRMALPMQAIRNLLLAALVHGVGAVNGSLPDADVDRDDQALSAAVMGARKLAVLPQLVPASEIIRYHTIDWNRRSLLRGGGEWLVESSILQFARWVTTALGRPSNILAAVPALETLAHEGRGNRFHPEVIDAFLSLAPVEGFWLDLLSNRLERIIARFQLPDVMLELEEIERLSWLFSLLIDERSRFTANHSSGVCAAAGGLAEALRWEKDDVAAMRIAGLLHDIGKLTVSNQILDKNGALSKAEWHAVRSHTFHTHRILEVVSGFDEVTCWAADHHETLVGTGYPFHKTGDDLPQGSRILAVADIFTALTEDRPYRAGLCKDEVAEILLKSVERKALDPEITDCLLANYEAINERRLGDQASQAIAAGSFWSKSQAEVRDLRNAVGSSVCSQRAI